MVARRPRVLFWRAGRREARRLVPWRVLGLNMNCTFTKAPECNEVRKKKGQAHPVVVLNSKMKHFLVTIWCGAFFPSFSFLFVLSIRFSCVASFNQKYSDCSFFMQDLLYWSCFVTIRASRCIQRLAKTLIWRAVDNCNLIWSEVNVSVCRSIDNTKSLNSTFFRNR